MGLVPSVNSVDVIPVDKKIAVELVRCHWASGSELTIRYHDEEWGVPAHDDRTLFEFLILEGAQAGLSWQTILNKRENYRAAFDQFDPGRVAAYDRRKMQRLLKDPGIVRNRLKISSAVGNATAFLRVAEQFGSFDRYIWRFVDGAPRVNSRKSPRQVPAKTVESDGRPPGSSDGPTEWAGPMGWFGLFTPGSCIRHWSDTPRHLGEECACLQSRDRERAPWSAPAEGVKVCVGSVRRAVTQPGCPRTLG